MYNTTKKWKSKFPTRSLALIMMVAPTAFYAELNAATITYNDGSTQHEVQAHSSAWITHLGLHPNADALATAIADSESHGLNPNSYELETVVQELNNFSNNVEKIGNTYDDSIVGQRDALENKLNKVFKQFALDMGRGVLDAQKTQRSLHRAAPSVDTDILLSRLSSGESTVNDILNELQPSTPYYTNLVSHMRVLLNERDSGVVRTKVRVLESVTLNSEHNSVIDLRSRLKETGDLDEYAPLSTYFGDDVAQALKAVQARHGIEETGELNERTAVALNASVDADIQEVAMNLERWRWMPRDLGERHIMVNIPAYTLYMMNGDQEIVNMPVVVGSKKHNTPIFSEDAKFVEVAPTWTVPPSITNKELIPKERKNPGYLKRERMDFFRWEGNRLVKVARSSVTQADFQKKKFPYMIRQRAGKGNALGELKILMPNKHAIYMHDTQAKSLFAKTDRAYSHGCIRLSDPFLLGGLLLQLDGHTQEETSAILAKKKTTRVKLNNTTPTHLAYFTSWVDESGRLNTRKDIYGHNKALIQGLKGSGTLLGTLKARSTAVIAEQGEL